MLQTEVQGIALYVLDSEGTRVSDSGYQQGLPHTRCRSWPYAVWTD